MEIDVLNMNGDKVRTVELPAEIFEAPIQTDLMHQAYMRQLANARLGTHDTKTRSEVSGGGRKPWKQKGTGRARQGSTRSTQWKGGGRVHTPHPRSYAMSMPRKMRRAALRSALSVKASQQAVVVIDEMTLPEIKTKLMAQSLSKLVGERTALVLIPDKSAGYEVVMLSTRNLPSATPLLTSYLNVRDILGHDTVVLPVAALDLLKQALA